MQHAEVLNLSYETIFLFLESKEALDPRYNKDLDLPQVIVEGENLGGFVGMIKRFPI